MILNGGSSMATQAPPAARKNAAAKSVTAKIAKPPATRPSEVVPVINQDRRRALIAEAAYFRAERRNFASGYETEDWLSAESEVDTLLTLGVTLKDN
jgi:Protein of unknown function (DUF2934)